MSDPGELNSELWRAIRRERSEREQAVKLLGDALSEELERVERELHERITTVHRTALRELTAVIERTRQP
jgi:hypothetical protein